MAFFLFFILVGVFMYLLDWLFLRLHGRVLTTSYLLSGAVAGVIFSLILHLFYPLTVLGWLVVMLVALSGGIALMLAYRLDFYKSEFFKVFGTVTLGLSTGIISWIILKILLLVGFIGAAEMAQFRKPLLDLLVYGFLLQFGYAVTGRLTRTIFRRSMAE